MIKIDITDDEFVAILGNKKAHTIIISNNKDEVFRETREKNLTSKILYEDECFRTYNGS